jgi:hypothetical protein
MRLIIESPDTPRPVPGFYFRRQILFGGAWRSGTNELIRLLSVEVVTPATQWHNKLVNVPGPQLSAPEVRFVFEVIGLHCRWQYEGKDCAKQWSPSGRLRRWQFPKPVEVSIS